MPCDDLAALEALLGMVCYLVESSIARCTRELLAAMPRGDVTALAAHGTVLELLVLRMPALPPGSARKRGPCGPLASMSPLPTVGATNSAADRRWQTLCA